MVVKPPCEEPLHAGDGLDAELDGVWVPVRYEYLFNRAKHTLEPYLHKGEGLLPDPTNTLLRWPSKFRPWLNLG